MPSVSTRYVGHGTKRGFRTVFVLIEVVFVQSELFWTKLVLVLDRSICLNMFCLFFITAVMFNADEVKRLYCYLNI